MVVINLFSTSNEVFDINLKIELKMGKNKKEHRKKVAKRNEKIKQQKNAYMKMQHKFVEELIKRERESGKFDNPSGLPNIDGPQILDGPQI